MPRDTNRRQGPTISGVVLAAGRSRRMGEPKALLPISGESFLTHALSVLRQGGSDDLVVVVGPGSRADSASVRAAAIAAGARTVENPAKDSEQIDSLRIGLSALPESTLAAVVTPVDHPGITPDIVARLIAAFQATGAPIVVPRYGSHHGHPVLFARAVFPELLEGDLPEGARTVVHRHAHDLHEVAVDDPSVVRDVNTPEEYRLFTGQSI